MRVLQAMAGAPVGGAENFFTRLVCALARNGLEQRALIRHDPTRMEALRSAGVDVTITPFGGFFDMVTRRRFAREIRRFRPDIVLTWMNRATAFCPRKPRRHGFVHIGTPRGYYDPKYFRACDHLVVTTLDLAQFYEHAGWPRARIEVIPNFAPDETAPPVSRAALTTPENACVLLALGRLHENKAFDVLIQALAFLPECYLWLAGDGPMAESLRAVAARAGVADRVRFLGWRSDTAALFAASDIFVCSSRHEPFGNIIIEAWAQRVPIVAAASEGPSALIEDGATGLLVPVDDAMALAAAVRRLIAEPEVAASLAAAGRVVYEKRYTEDAVVRRYRELFARLAG